MFTMTNNYLWTLQEEHWPWKAPRWTLRNRSASWTQSSPRTSSGRGPSTPASKCPNKKGRQFFHPHHPVKHNCSPSKIQTRWYIHHLWLTCDPLRLDLLTRWTSRDPPLLGPGKCIGLNPLFSTDPSLTCEDFLHLWEKSLQVGHIEFLLFTHSCSKQFAMTGARDFSLLNISLLLHTPCSTLSHSGANNVMQTVHFTHWVD